MIDVLGVVHSRRGVAAPVRRGADRSVVTTGYLISEPDPETYMATVSVLGSEPISGVPAAPATYTGVTAVHVLLDQGRPVQVLSPAGSLPVEDPTAPIFVPAPPPATPSSTRVVTGRVVAPSFTGTYRVSRGAWGRWNDASDVYQSGSPNSGTLYGLAAYGDQIVALGASEITRARLTLVSNGQGFVPAFDAVVQGSASGSQPAGAPAFTGDTATVSVPGYGHTGGKASVDLPASVRESLRAGSVKGLGLTGSTYGGTLGLGRGAGDAWVLTLDYKVSG